MPGRLQEFRITRQENRRLLVKDFLVGLQCSQQLEELGILLVGLAVGPRGLGLGLAADDFRFGIRLGQNDRLLLIGRGADLHRLFAAFRSVTLGDAGALLAHPVEDALADLVGQADPLDLHIDQYDAELVLRIAGAFLRDTLDEAFQRVRGRLWVLGLRS
jgi:hypothetical protein